ncbi:MAG TPA: response regulator [Candidatus Polarisedimenticolaceae bacterium]|nr:response regulator [Candidatus Polarisedimenticolaceae bacterium]
MKVLVVEQEAFLAELIKLALEADGHACFTSRSVEEASEVLRSVEIDLLTLDLLINGHSPLPWLEDLVVARPELQGRVFILTARLLDHAESLRVRACSARVIQKPFTLHQLRETVRMMTPA